MVWRDYLRGRAATCDVCAHSCVPCASWLRGAGTELHYQRLPGVIATAVGYTQGRLERPTYNEVCGGRTGHTEACQLIYDPKVVTYTELCEKLFTTIDPTLRDQVGNDYGTQCAHGARRERAGRPALRPAPPMQTPPPPLAQVSPRHLLPQPLAGAGGEGVPGEAASDAQAAIWPVDRDGMHGGSRILARRGAPPAVPAEGRALRQRPVSGQGLP